MIGEIDLGGVYLSPLLPCLLVGFFLRILISRGLKSAGLYRHLWHPILFDISLFFVLVGAVFALLSVLTTTTG